MRQLAVLIVAALLLTGCLGDPLSHEVASQPMPSAGLTDVASTDSALATSAVSAPATASQTPAASPSLSVSPDRGPIGMSATVTGQGYQGTAQLTIAITNLDTNESGEVGSAQTDASGNFAATLAFDQYTNGGPIGPGVFSLGVYSGGTLAGPTAILQLTAPGSTTTPAAASAPASLTPTTLARPAPTQVPASPSLPPTASPTPGTPAMVAIVARNANVYERLVGGAGSKALDAIRAGETVLLRERSSDGAWFVVVTGRGQIGWVGASALTINPTVANVVPVVDLGSAGAVPAVGQKPIATISAQSPTTVPPVQLTLDSYTTYTSTSVIFVVGEAMNRGDRALDEVSVSAALTTASGGVVDRTSANLANFRVAPAHGLFPFILWFANPGSDWKSVTIEAHGIPVQNSDADVPPYLQLQSRNTDIHAQADGLGYTVTGKIANTGSQSAEDVVVAVIAYDGAGKVVDVASTSIDAGALAPGASADFTAQLTNASTNVAGYRVLAQGIVAARLGGAGG